MKQIGIWTGIIVIFAATIWGLIAWVNNNNSPGVLSSQAINLPPVSKDDIVFGDPQKAKVTLVEYADFQCLGCAEKASLIRLLKKDFDDKLLVIYRFFPLPQHQNAMFSSQAAYAAGKQNKFWEMSDMIYGDQENWANSPNAKDLFTEYAKKLDLDIVKFVSDYNAETTRKFITDQMNSGISIGLSYTPTFFLNGKRIDDPQGYEALKKLIQDELKNE